MTYYYQRLLGALLGFFCVGPLLTFLLGGALGIIGSLELLLGAVIGALVGVYSAGRIARSKDGRTAASSTS